MMNSIIRKHYIVLVVLALLFAGMSIFSWKFALLIMHKKSEVVSYNQRIKFYEENKKIISEESILIEEIEKRLGVLESNIITTENLPEFLSSLEEMAESKKIIFSITTVQTPGANSASKKLIVDFSASGKEQDLYDFLNELTHQVVQIKFNKLSFSHSIEDGAQSQWHVLGSIEVISF